MDPEETLEYLKNISSTRTKRSLDAVYKTCQEQLEQDLSNFSISTIARVGAKYGVPSLQSIRNKTGEHYRLLIRSFVENSNVKKPIKRTKSKDSWVDEIKDQKLKFLVQVQTSELSELRRLLKEIVPIKTEIRIYDRQTANDVKLNGLERQALEYLVSEGFLKKWGFEIGKHGDVIDENKDKVFKVATIDAIDKVLKNL